MTIYRNTLWQLGLFAIITLCLVFKTVAEEPLVQAPNTPVTEPNVSEPGNPDPPTTIQPPSLPLPPSQPHSSPSLHLHAPSRPTFLSNSSTYNRPTSNPSPSGTIQFSANPTSPPTTTIPTSKKKEHRGSRNRAAIALDLVHVPLKTSCEILRRLYNTSGGVNWVYQDGWQYVDSIRIPNTPRGRHHSHIEEGLQDDIDLRRRGDRSRAMKDRYPPSNNNDDYDDDGGDNDGFSPQLPQPPTRKTLPSTPPESRPIPPLLPPSYDYDDSDPLQGSLYNPSPTLDPDNCCGWYGVVCIGPDGVIPPPWPPYDEDLVSSRFRMTTPSSRYLSLRKRLDTPHLRKRLPPPYYHYDRIPHHGPHGRHGDHRHGTGGEDNRHQADDDNNENGQYPDNGFLDDDSDNEYEEDDSYYGHRDPRMRNPVEVWPGQRGHVKDDWYIIEL
ncbi:hypothetical protein FBU30_003861 [Linnemannia zychae]|nr:hypothetical protein FBU30_003861 [Linnemannia zychae]